MISGETSEVGATRNIGELEEGCVGLSILAVASFYVTDIM